MQILSDIVYNSGKNFRFCFFSVSILLLSSCGTQNQLKKTWMNQPELKLREAFGSPTTIIDRNSEKVFIFEKTEELESTEINQGKLTLDPVITPKVLKTERYIFTISEGIIIRTNFEENYERY